MENVCGKSRESCTWKEQLDCGGCREDMGKLVLLTLGSLVLLFFAELLSGKTRRAFRPAARFVFSFPFAHTPRSSPSSQVSVGDRGTVKTRERSSGYLLWWNLKRVSPFSS